MFLQTRSKDRVRPVSRTHDTVHSAGDPRIRFNPPRQRAAEQMPLSWATWRYRHCYAGSLTASSTTSSSFITIKHVPVNEELAGVAINIVPCRGASLSPAGPYQPSRLIPVSSHGRATGQRLSPNVPSTDPGIRRLKSRPALVCPSVQDHLCMPGRDSGSTGGLAAQPDETSAQVPGRAFTGV